MQDKHYPLEQRRPVQGAAGGAIPATTLSKGGVALVGGEGVRAFAIAYSRDQLLHFLDRRQGWFSGRRYSIKTPTRFSNSGRLRPATADPTG